MGKRFNPAALQADTKRAKDATQSLQEEASFYAIKAEKEKEELRRLQDDNAARKSFAHYIFTVTVIWMFFILMIVIACGEKSMELSDTVLVALITTTTANVFGFLYVVVNYLFNKEKST